MTVFSTMVAKLAVAFTAVISILVISIPGSHNSVINRHARAAMMIDMRGFPDPGNLCPRGATFYRNATDCSLFYRCVDFNYNGKHTVFRFMCGANTVFNEKWALCVRPSQANPPCTSTSLPNPITSATTTSKPITTTPGIADTNSTTTPSTKPTTTTPTPKPIIVNPDTAEIITTTSSTPETSTTTPATPGTSPTTPITSSFTITESVASEIPTNSASIVTSPSTPETSTTTVTTTTSPTTPETPVTTPSKSDSNTTVQVTSENNSTTIATPGTSTTTPDTSETTTTAFVTPETPTQNPGTPETISVTPSTSEISTSTSKPTPTDFTPELTTTTPATSETNATTQATSGSITSGPSTPEITTTTPSAETLTTTHVTSENTSSIAETATLIPTPPIPTPGAPTTMLINIVRLEYVKIDGTIDVEYVVPPNAQHIVTNTLDRPSSYVDIVGAQLFNVDYETSTIVIRPTPTPTFTESISSTATPPLTDVPADGGKSFSFTQWDTTYTVTLPVPYVPADSKYVTPSEPVKLAITTMVTEASGTTTTIFTQNAGNALEPSVPTYEVDHTVVDRVVNVDQDLTVITETQLIKPTVTTQNGRPITHYRTVTFTFTVAPTRVTQLIRPTTVITNNQIITSTAYQTLTIRPLINSVAYYYTTTVTVTNGQTITKTLTELLRPTDISPEPIPPYTTMPVLEPATVTLNDNVTTVSAVETVILNSNYIVPTIEPPQPHTPATVTYLDPSILESPGQLVTSSIHRVTTLRPYIPTFATITRYSVITITGQPQITTYIKTVTLPPPSPITSIIRPTTTLSGGTIVTVTAADTFFTDPVISQGTDGSPYEIQSSMIDSITGDIYVVNVGPTGGLTSQVISGLAIQPSYTLFVTYIRRLTLYPQASTFYSTLTVTKNGLLVTVTALQTIRASTTTIIVSQTTSVPVNSAKQLVIDGQTVPIPATVVAFEPTTVTVNGQITTETIIKNHTLRLEDIAVPSIEPSLTVAPITLTYLNPDVVPSLGQVVTLSISSFVPVWPYRPVTATYVKSVVITQTGQAQTVAHTHTVTLQPSVQLTSILRPTSTLNGQIVTTSAFETFTIDTQAPQGGVGLYEIEGSKIGDLFGEIKRFEVQNGSIQSAKPISKGEVRPGNRLLVTYIKWLTLRPQISTIYRTITATQSGGTVTLTALQTIMATAITTSVLVPTTVQVRPNNNFVIQDKNFTFKQELSSTIPPPSSTTTGSTTAGFTGFRFKCRSDGFPSRSPLNCNQLYQCIPPQNPTQEINYLLFNCEKGSIFDEQAQQCREPASNETCHKKPKEDEDLLRSGPKFDGSGIDFSGQITPGKRVNF